MNPVEQLRNSADLIQKNRPSYKDILDFYARVFEEQEKSRSDLVLEPVVIEQALLDLKKESDMPLITPSQFKVDTDHAVKLLITICGLAREYAPNLSGDAEKIQQAVTSGDLDPNLLFSAILENLESVLADISAALTVPVPHLVLFGYHSMAPCITACARQLAPYLDETEKHSHGYCPICSSKPDLAVLDEKGRRHLKCSFCAHQWLTKRMGCAFCDTTDPDKQQYFFTNDEKEYRVNLCDHCKNYIKVVDLRQMNRYFHPGLELISTLHLDMAAKEQGYAGGSA